MASGVIWKFVPNVRAEGQTLISFPLDEEFLAKLDAARGHKTRSQFIREAIFREVKSLGIPIDPKFIFPPDRAKIVQIVGNNNRNVSLRAAERSPRYKTKKKAKRK
jgi:hypothetical protein